VRRPPGCPLKTPPAILRVQHQEPRAPTARDRADKRSHADCSSSTPKALVRSAPSTRVHGQISCSTVRPGLRGQGSRWSARATLTCDPIGRSYPASRVRLSRVCRIELSPEIATRERALLFLLD